MTKPPSSPSFMGSAFDVNRKPRYIENKLVNPSTIEALLAHSARVNQWTNFGPLCQLLEEKLAQLLAVPDHLRVVACSNATVALHALVAMHTHLTGKPLRWVTSAFGFYSSCDGILQSAQIVDSDRYGMLDLDLLDPDEFDGFIVTNIFGQHDDLAIYREYASKHQKIMLVDAAMAFHAGGHIANECISLHHTKPWGFGEGGCAIVDQYDEELFRDLLAFGHNSPSSPINRLAFNGKISDVSCAYIIMRLEEVSQVRESYLQQYERIAAIGTSLGLKLLDSRSPHPGIPANVPFLFPRSTTVSADPPVPARKYYFPLAQTPVAADIYRRIVNVACHSEMASVSDKAIEDFLAHYLR